MRIGSQIYLWDLTFNYFGVCTWGKIFTSCGDSWLVFGGTITPCFCFLETGSPCVSQADLQLLLSEFLKSWIYRCAVSHSATHWVYSSITSLSPPAMQTCLFFHILVNICYFLSSPLTPNNSHPNRWNGVTLWCFCLFFYSGGWSHTTSPQAWHIVVLICISLLSSIWVTFHILLASVSLERYLLKSSAHF